MFPRIPNPKICSPMYHFQMGNGIFEFGYQNKLSIRKVVIFFSNIMRPYPFKFFFICYIPVFKFRTRFFCSFLQAIKTSKRHSEVKKQIHHKKRHEYDFFHYIFEYSSKGVLWFLAIC